MPRSPLVPAAHRIATQARWIRERRCYEVERDDMYGLLDALAAAKTDGDTREEGA